MRNKNNRLIALMAIAVMAFMHIVATAQNEYHYPATRKMNQVDTFFGVTVEDPYRWMENDTTTEVKAWITAQNRLTNGYLEKIPFREALRKQITNLNNVPFYTPPRHVGEYYFFSANTGLLPQDIIYRKKGMNGKPEVFIDPNTFSADSTTSVYLNKYSEDKKMIIATVNVAGSDITNPIVYEVATGKEMPDHLDGIKNSSYAWKGNGFYYSRYPIVPKGKELTALNDNQSVYYHVLGTPQTADKLVFETRDKPLSFNYADITENKRFLIVFSFSGNNNTDIYYRDFQSADAALHLLVRGKDNANDGIVDDSSGMIIMQTDRGAPNGKIVLVDPKHPDSTNWKTLVAEKEEPIKDISTAYGKLFITYLKDVTSRIYQYDYSGQLEKEIKLPDLGNAYVTYGLKEDADCYYGFSSFLYPYTVFKYNIPTGKTEPFFTMKTKVSSSDYESQQVFYNSKDGTKVPMFMVHKKGIQLNGSHTTLLTAYGGYGVNSQPYYNPSIFPLLDAGGIYAVANIRGGGEYGEKWHRAGMLLNTQNRFDDFIAAAEWLVKEKYTSPAKLGITGGSHGGCLVASVMLQRPDLFKVVIPRAGTLDMLRFQKFTVGWNWTREYGNPDSAAGFRNLIAYSPVHNVKKGVSYPATLVTTADHDDRVVPMHSFKFISQLQAKQSVNAPVFIRIDTNSAHGSSSFTKYINDETEVMSFLFYNTGTAPSH